MDLVTLKAIQTGIGIGIFALILLAIVFFPSIWNNWSKQKHKKTK